MTASTESVSGNWRRSVPRNAPRPQAASWPPRGHDLEQDVLWIDYDASVSLHRMIAGRPDDRCAQRLGSASTLDNRISYGCINVPAEFYDKHVAPAFGGTVGIVYILPETKPLAEVFPMADKPRRQSPGTTSAPHPHLNDSRLPPPPNKPPTPWRRSQERRR